jgi:hypothetical protein
MKVKDLIKEIENYPDYELELTNVVVYEGRQCRPDFNTFPVLGVADIGHSDKVIVLDGGTDSY